MEEPQRVQAKEVTKITRTYYIVVAPNAPGSPLILVNIDDTLDYGRKGYYIFMAEVILWQTQRNTTSK